MEVNFRERAKEVWGKFTVNHRPYLDLGCYLHGIRKNKLYIWWGHADIRDYLANELHLPYTQYSLYIAAIRQAYRLNLTIGEGDEVDEKYTVGHFLNAARVSKTKVELFQRLKGEWQGSSYRKRYTIGPFILSHKEIFNLWMAGGFRGKFDEFSKDDLMRIAKK